MPLNSSWRQSLFSNLFQKSEKKVMSCSSFLVAFDPFNRFQYNNNEFFDVNLTKISSLYKTKVFL